jgi:hypothetical protein
MMAMETTYEGFPAGVRDLLDLIAAHHGTNLSNLLQDGMIDAMLLLSNRIPDDTHESEGYYPFFTETIIHVKKRRFKFPASISFFDTMKEWHEQGKDTSKDDAIRAPPKLNFS